MAYCSHLAPNGQKSLLYDDLWNLYHDDAIAHSAWEAVRSEEFKTKYGDWTKQSAPAVQQPYPGVENIPDSGLTIARANQFLTLLQPQILNQAYIENKAKTANRMFSFGMRWAKQVPNENEQSQQNSVKGTPRPGKVAIRSYNDYTYGYYGTDQNNGALPPMTQLQPIMDFIQEKLGIDMTHYDSMLANIYEHNSFIHQHRDVTESKEAGNYPVIVLNLGADGGLLFDKGTSDKDLHSKDAYAEFERTIRDKVAYKDRIGVLPIHNGGIYAFGVDGVNRFTFNHRIMDGIGQTPTQPIQVPVWDDHGNKVGEKTLTEYRITLTFRRSGDLQIGEPPVPLRTQPATTPQQKNTDTVPLDANGEPRAEWVRQTLQLPPESKPVAVREEVVRHFEPDAQERPRTLSTREPNEAMLRHIEALYEEAAANPSKDFKLDYEATRWRYRSGYTSAELAALFDSMPIPANVRFTDSMAAAHPELAAPYPRSLRPGQHPRVDGP
jgi:hypothetical protein